MLILANEALEKTTWYPLTLGWLVVLAGIGMFFGSTYLLLSTNVGARQGFLVVGATAMGFITILSTLWMTTATPLNVFKGRQEAWKPVEIVQNVESSNIKEIQTIKEKGTKLSATDFSNVKAAADTILAPAAEGTETHKPEQIADDLPTVDVLVTEIYGIGGSKPNPLHFEFTHVPEYAAVQYCQLDEEKSLTAFRSTCDTSEEAKSNSKVLILENDLGSLRQPPTFLFFGSLTLLIVFLLVIHWRDKDLRQSKNDLEQPDESADEESDKSDEKVDA